MTRALTRRHLDFRFEINNCLGWHQVDNNPITKISRSRLAVSMGQKTIAHSDMAQSQLIVKMLKVTFNGILIFQP